MLNEFFIPALSKTVEYKRLTGFFSSSTLAVAARGIISLIENSGNMKLISCAIFSESDIQSIKAGIENPEKILEKYMLKSLDEIEDEFVKNHIEALGWLIANKKLDIKIAIIRDEDGNPLNFEKSNSTGVFHQKVGIFIDIEGNMISFSGSINETGMAWKNNIEEFKVFKGWDNSEKKYFEVDLAIFNRFWFNKAKRTEIIDMPKAISEKMIEIRSKSFSKLKNDISNNKSVKKIKIELYKYQKTAIQNWLKNDMIGLFEMATGTGKTLTAVGCVDEFCKKHKNRIIIIVSPKNHIIDQWKKEIHKYGLSFPSVTCNCTNQNWKNILTDGLLDISLNNEKDLVVYTTHQTFHKKNFREILTTIKNDSEIPILLVVDEVHWVGAKKTQYGLIDIYDYRLGLSATPKRFLDLEGTEVIYDYFKGKDKTIVYKFPLDKAINEINPRTNDTYLTPYKYNLRFVTLLDTEIEEYISLTKSIIYKYSQASKEEKQELELNLLYKRADVVKNAHNKLKELDKILDILGEKFKHTIIYCSNEQFRKVLKKCNIRKIYAHPFTQHEESKPNKDYGGISERRFILKKFGQGEFQVLVAMKCLDEGVDIKPAETAILMSSSGNPREYIQRIGRIIRRYPGKEVANIYDIIVVPSFKLGEQYTKVEKKIFEKEIKRYMQIAENAINRAEAYEKLTEVREKLGGSFDKY